MKEKCKHCRREKGVHKAGTFHCPIGPRTRAGYIFFSRDQTFEAKPTKETK